MVFFYKNLWEQANLLSGNLLFASFLNLIKIREKIFTEEPLAKYDAQPNEKTARYWQFSFE